MLLFKYAKLYALKKSQAVNQPTVLLLTQIHSNTYIIEEQTLYNQRFFKKKKTEPAICQHCNIKKISIFFNTLYANSNTASYHHIYHFISAPGGHIEILCWILLWLQFFLYEQATPIVTRE